MDCKRHDERDRKIASKYPKNKIPVPLKNPKFHVPLIILDKKKYNEFYNTFSNSILWFMHHQLWDLDDKPQINDDIHQAWLSYEYVNKEFADKIVEEIKSAENESLIMIQDYHLETCPGHIREQFEDVFLSQFIHVPWPQPDYFSILPEYMQEAIIKGLLSNNHIGFHIKKYVKNFLMICEEYADEVNFKKNIVHYDGREHLCKELSNIS